MGAIRRQLGLVVCACLCVQLSLLTAAPLSLLTNVPHADASMACTCVHAGATECPMHHPAKKSGCECRNTTDPDAASLVSLVGPAAVLPAAPVHLAPPAITRSPVRPVTQFIDFVAPPDGPPPRA